MPRDDACVFCKIVAGELTATNRTESARTVAFDALEQVAPTHVLVIPRDHYATVAELAAADSETLAELVSRGQAIAAERGVADTGWRLVFNSGPDAGQSVFHVHGHVLGGRAMTWPPG